MKLTIRLEAEPGTIYAADAFANNIGKRIEVSRGAIDGAGPGRAGSNFGIVTDVKVREDGKAVELTVIC